MLYYAGITASALGVACLDLEARANCGFFPLQNRGGSPSSANGLAGLVASSGNLYGASTTGQVLCLVMASRTPCAGQPYTAVVPGNNDAPGSGQPNYLGAMTLAAGKVFVSSSPQGGQPPVLGCFDPTAATVCAGWGTPHPVGVNGSYTYNAYTAFDTTGNVDGVCANVTNSTAVATCYALDGSPRTAPAGFGPTSDLWFNPETITAPNGHLRSYFPHWGAGATTCYDDWTHDLLVEKITPAEPGVAYPRCVTGRRAGPPEDCGGIWGYLDLLETLADPTCEEHEERLEWLVLESAKDFDPARFDLDEINQVLAQHAKTLA